MDNALVALDCAVCVGRVSLILLLRESQLGLCGLWEQERHPPVGERVGAETSFRQVGRDVYGPRAKVATDCHNEQPVPVQRCLVGSFLRRNGRVVPPLLKQGHGFAEPFADLTAVRVEARHVQGGSPVGVQKPRCLRVLPKGGSGHRGSHVGRPPLSTAGMGSPQ